MKQFKKYSVYGVLILGCAMSIGLKAIDLENWMKLKLSMYEALTSRQEITLSFAGDCTLGTYYGQGEGNRFDQVEKKEGKAYFLEKVKPIFEADDLTVVNLEGPLTTGGKRQDKQFAIKGDPSYVDILKLGSVEAVSLANNHTYDYGQEGLQQTQAILDKNQIDYFGNSRISYQEVQGVKVALIGEKGWDKSAATKKRLQQAISQAKKQTDLVVIMFHWGNEREHMPNAIQKDLAHFCIDEGVDLVVGSHPHVMQGIETYKGKNIIYSFGNFSFGANKNPEDKDTFIYQETYTLEKDQVIRKESKVIPCSISSSKVRNNYQPTPLEGKEAERVLQRLKKYSDHFQQSYFK